MSDELKKLLAPLQAVEPDPAEVGRWSASLRRPRRPLGLPLALAAAGLVLAALWVVGQVSAPPRKFAKRKWKRKENFFWNFVPIFL